MLAHYKISEDKAEFTYQFISEGTKGQIKKIVRFVKIGKANYFQFGFGDWNEEIQDVDDKVVTNNKDTTKVLATLGVIIEHFTNIFPDAWIFAQANSSTRTRFYRIILSQNLALIQEKYQLLGLLKGVWKPFIPNKTYTAFLIKRK